MAKSFPLAPAFLAQTRALVRSFKQRGVAIRVTSVRRTHHLHSTGDRYTLKIPYCHGTLQWEVMFDMLHPAAPPDFIFDEASAPAFDLATLATLSRSWHLSDDRCLTRAVEELLYAYGAYQAAKLPSQGLERLAAEYRSVEDVAGLEVSVQDVKGGVVLLVVLPLEQTASSGCLPPSPGGERCQLWVRFDHLAGSTSVTPSLYAPHLPTTSKRPLPDWNGSLSLAEYRKLVVANVRASWMSRQSLMEALFRLYPDRLEYDSDDGSHVSFICKTNRGFGCIAKVQMLPDFPKRCPVLTLQAMRTGTHGTAPVATISSGYPYSPRWDADEMADRLKSTLLDEMAKLEANIKAGVV